jgi:hypothetical protein
MMPGAQQQTAEYRAVDVPPLFPRSLISVEVESSKE